MSRDRAWRWAFVVGMIALVGCASRPKWPKEPELTSGPPSNRTAAVWRPSIFGPRYLQSYRNGVKRALYLEDGPGQYRLVADLDEVDTTKLRFIFIFLDGVPYKLFSDMYDQGHFRLFFKPAKMISPFPSLTDISFSTIFGVPGTSCYESIVFNPRTNEFYDPLPLYLSGDNELWATRLDYRQRLWLDALSYMWPKYYCRREFGAMFKKVRTILKDKPSQRDILIYSISTDAACHIVSPDDVRKLLRELDRYIERVVHDNPGKVGIVMCADHGNNMVPNCQKVKIEAPLKAAGLKPIFNRGFKKPGEVVVPRYGLISFMRAYFQSDEDRLAFIDAIRHVEGIEQIMWMQGGRAYVVWGDDEATIGYRKETGPDGEVEEFYSYRPTQGDPLELKELLAPLEPKRFAGDPDRWYESVELLKATADHEWPDPLWRIWHGMTDQTALTPGVAVSIGPGWYYGEGGLDAFAKLDGTHGGLRQDDTATFFTTTLFTPSSPMRTTDVIDVVNDHIPWTPATEDPAKHGMHKYLGSEK